jgi:hypothetical protein
LRGRLPMELALDFRFLFPMYGGAEGAFIDGIASVGGRARACDSYQLARASAFVIS